MLIRSSDVFMDSVNRDVSMRMLVRNSRKELLTNPKLTNFFQIIAARRSVGKQFILITPQSMGNVPVERDVKIIKWVFLRPGWHRIPLLTELYRLSDPERGQTTISFPEA